MCHSMILSTAIRARIRPEGPANLITHLAAARSCGVSPLMVIRWVETGAWPLPRSIRGTSLYFDPSDVDVWVETGAWPTASRFCRGSEGELGRHRLLSSIS